MAGDNGKNMSMGQFFALMAEIMEKHGWRDVRGHMIKYIKPTFDTRSGDFYGVTFQGLRGEKDFYVVNENADRDLYQWVMEFLNTPPNEAGWEQKK